MVNVGIVGIGFMGRIHTLALQQVPGARLAAVCSRDPAKLAGDWSATRGNFGPEPGYVDLAGVSTYSTLAEMLADPGIDLVDICTPTDQHPDAAIQALKAGKHVLVEKAIALTTAAADRMLAAAPDAGKLLMVAHVLPFFPEFAWAADAVRSGRFGKLLGGHLTRVISAPDWSPEMADASKTGGPAVDLHVHDTHFIGLLCGKPRAVTAIGRVDASGAVSYLSTCYRWGPDAPVMTCSSGAIATTGRPFAHGFELYLERATLAYHSGGVPLTCHTADGRSEVVTLPGTGDPLAAFVAELSAATEAVRTGDMPSLLSGRLARDALALCHAEIQSVGRGGEVAVD